MVSTGVEALDGRLGLLEKGRTYSFFGPGAAGKSVLGLHFLIDGLDRGESCVLITRDEPVMVDSRAVFMGYSGGRLTEHTRLRVVRLPAVIPTPQATMAPGEALVLWLHEQLGGRRPDRIVLDSVEWLAEYSPGRIMLMQHVTEFLRSTQATCYALARTDREALVIDSLYGGLAAASAGVFTLHVSQRGERRFHFRTAPEGAFRTDPFDFSLRIGAGLTEEHAMQQGELGAEDRRKVIVLDEIGALPDEVMAGLEQQYDLTVLRSAAGALTKLSTGRYGALVMAVNPYEEMRAFDLAFALRKDGNAAPILFVAPSRGLRSSTRARGLRIGGDDFFVAELPAAEVLERIHLAWTRGRHQPGSRSQVGHIVQPMTDARVARPMTESEFRQAMDTLLAEQPPLFFCYLEFTLTDGVPEVVWPALRSRLRVGDGDIIGMLGHQRFGCYLDRITPEQTSLVIERIRASHPLLRQISNVIVIASPSQADAIRARLDGAAAGASSPVPGAAAAV